MNTTGPGVRRTKPRVQRLLAPALVAMLVCSTAQPVLASAIRASAKAQTIKPASTVVTAYWNRYYATALQQHRLQIKGIDALKVLRPAADGRLPQLPIVAYLEWRRSLNPKRFDFFHPTLGPMLHRNQIIRSIPEPVIPTTPPPGPVNPPPAPQVPEPGSILVGLSMIGAGILARRWARSRMP